MRADQVDAALPELRRLDAPLIVTLVNLADRAGSVADAIGRERVVLGFPGVGGVRTAAGVGYHQIRQQPTTIGRTDGREATLLRCLRAAGLPVAVVPDMRAWLATHTLFIAGTGAAILAAGGSEAVDGTGGAPPRWWPRSGRASACWRAAARGSRHWRWT